MIISPATFRVTDPGLKVKVTVAIFLHVLMGFNVFTQMLGKIISLASVTFKVTVAILEKTLSLL